MKYLTHLSGIALLLATSLLLTSCGVADVESEPAQAAQEERSMSLSQEGAAAQETPAADKGLETGFDPTCDDNCFPGACRDCLRGCREDFDGQQEEDCLHVCSFCGHPCFC